MRSGTIAAPESSFTFENIYQEEDNQGLYEKVGVPLVESVISGFNGTIFAYGQTGSGKARPPLSRSRRSHICASARVVRPRVL